jgi:hypothetical protein
MGLFSVKVKKPKVNYTKDMQRLLSAYQKVMPSVTAFEQLYRPQFQGLNLGDISTFLGGTDTQQGIWGLSALSAQQAQQGLNAARQAELAGMTSQADATRGLVQAVSPEAAQAIEQQRQLATRAGSLESEYGSAYQQAASQYAPDISRVASTLNGVQSQVSPTMEGVSGIVGSNLGGISGVVGSTLSGMSGDIGTNLGGLSGLVKPTISGRNLSTAQADQMAKEAFARRGSLSAEEMRMAQQAAREAAAASGRIGSGSQFAAEVLNREEAKAARRGEAYQAINQSFGQQATAAQERLAREQAMYGQQTGNVERDIGLRQAQYGQSAANIERDIALRQAQYGQGASDLERDIALRQAQYGQLASDTERNMAARQALYGQQVGNVERNIGLQQGLFGQNMASMQQQEAAKQQGMNQFFAQQAGLQSLRGEQAGYYGGLSNLAGSTYMQPGLSMLGSQPLSYQTGQQQLGLGLGAIGAGTPQLYSPDAALNLGAANRQNQVAAGAASAQARAGMLGGLFQGIGSLFG